MTSSAPSSMRSGPGTARARSARATARSASPPIISRKGASPTIASASPRTSFISCSRASPRSTRSSMRSLPSIKPPSSPPCRRRGMAEPFLPEHPRSLLAPPWGGGRIGKADPRGVTEVVGTTDSKDTPPSLSLPLKGGGESKLRSPCSVQEAFVAAVHVFREAGIAMPELDARLLLCHAAGLTHEAYTAQTRDPLRPEAGARLGAAIARRLKREPVARITGTREVYGRKFHLDPHALDPRPDTETLIEAALAHLARKGLHDSPLKLLDLGTGTGCILVTLLAELPRARGLGTDMSCGALASAATNARRLGVAARAAFVAAD